jgi:hypothetical protein
MFFKRTFSIVVLAGALMLALLIGSRMTSNAFTPSATQAGVTIPYSGHLTNNMGQPVADGAYSLTFRLYEAETSGTALWTESLEGVQVQGGAFSVLLGGTNPLPKTALDITSRWLEIGVRGPGDKEFTPLNPRQKLSSADTTAAAGKTSTSALSCIHNHWGETWSGMGVGLHLTSTNSYGVWGESVSNIGVLGKTTVATGDTVGVWGEIASSGTYARGVVGYATKTIGVNYGVWGQTQSTDGIGVYGLAAATAGGANYGVYGKTQSVTGVGVYGEATNTSGSNVGVIGKTLSPDGMGVYGEANSSANGCVGGYYGKCRGVYGTSEHGDGVVGHTTDGFGVYALATGAGAALVADVKGNGIGLYVDSSGTGNLIEAWGLDREFAVSNNGNVYADGTYTSPAADFAEMLTAKPGLEPGDVLVVGDDGQLARSSAPFQPSVVGVYSTKPGFVGGGDGADQTGKVPLAVVGVVPVKASAENGAIRPGDLLVASATPGYAMKAGSNPPVGTIIGKALASLSDGKGVIQMLVTLQ